MNISELINEIISEWAYRVDDGMPDAKNPIHINELGIVLKEMGLSHIKNTLIENLLSETGTTPQEVDEAEEGAFKNPILNKVIKYKNTKGEETDGVVGNLLRLPAEHPGRKAAEALLPPEGSEEREKMNQDLGGQNQAAKPDAGGDKKDGEQTDGGADDAEQKKQQAAMFTSDPAMVARMDREKDTLEKLAAKDAEDKQKEKEAEEANPLDAKFTPIDPQDVAKEMPQSDPETFGGGTEIPDGVEPSELEQFNTDISKVAQLVANAKANGEKAPNINLCDVTVPGTNLYCDDNLGIPRAEMPQFKGTAQPGTRAASMDADASGEVDTEPVFREMLKEKGIKTLQTEVPADKLKATQSELVGAKVVGMMGALEENPEHEKITAPIYVSRDGFVIDGHHRWAAIVAYNAKHPDNQIQMKTTVIDMDIKDAIPMANKFAEDMGIAAKKADANKEDTTQAKGTELKTNETDSSSNVKTFKGESSGKEIKTVELEGGGFLFGTQHRDTKMADDIINQVKATIPKERWKDIVFVGEGGATNDNGELEFHDEMKYSAPKFKEMGASIDTWDGDELDVHNDQSELYKSQEEQTGLPQSKIKAGNWASMIGQGEGTDTMSPNDYLDDEGKDFLQQSAKEAGFPQIENWDNPTEQDIDTLYRLSFPEDNGDKETGVNDVQVAFNKARDLNLIKKQKQLSSQGKIPVVMAGESHADLVDDIMKNKKQESKMTEENLQLADELMLEMIYEFIDEASPNAKAQRILNQRIKYKEDGVEHDVKVSTAIKYKNSEKPGQKKAYKDALQLLKKSGVTVPDSGTTKKPVGKTIAPSGFRKTPDMEKKPKKAEPKVEPKPTKRSETNNPHKKNGDEGETIAELNPQEIDSILEKYVNAGEKTPDDMREITPEYANQDMADGYSDDDYYSTSNGGRKHSSLVRQKPYKIDESTRTELKNAGFPEKYIKFLERCINTQVKGKKPPVTELIKQGGAGQIQSQFGEVMAMAFMSIRDPQQRRQLADIMNAEIQKSAEEFGGGKQSPIATKDWVEASITHAEAFDSAMDEKYGKGQWRFEGAAWDIKGDIEALGLDYKNKGFSTDVMLRVQPLKNGKPNGPARAQKNSLKKDENIFFFNGSINEVNNFVLNYLDEKERKRVRGYESIVTKAGASNKNPEDKAAALAAAERITGLKGTKAIAALKQMAADIRTKAFNAAPANVQESVSKVRNFGAAQTASAEKLIKTANTNIKNANNVIDNAKNIDGGDKDFAKFAYKAVKDCKASGTKDLTTCIRQKLSAAGEDTTDDRVCKVAVLASKVAIAAGDTAAEKALNKHYNLAIEAGNALMTVLPESPELMGGLMQKLADAFPMKTCMEGEEFMCIDGMKVTQKTLQTVFGVASYDELQKGMKLKRLPNGETILVYGAKSKDGKDIPIGVVGARQKGKGYEGTVGFEISCSDDFALAIAEANKKNGDTSSSNEKARQSIGNRVNKRAAKADKKK